MIDRQDPTLLTAKQAAARFDISTRSFYEWVQSGTFPLPILRRGRRMAFSSASIDRYINGEIRASA